MSVTIIRELTSKSSIDVQVRTLQGNIVGMKGERGHTGKQGDPFTYEDFTEEQLALVKGDPFVYEDFTPEQFASLKGDKGDKGERGNPFIYADFTENQLAGLQGEKGDTGNTYYATFDIDIETGELMMYYHEEYKGAMFQLTNNNLEVII